MPNAMWRCPDGGTCHHDCRSACFRVLACGPLSGEFRGDEWPAEIEKLHTDYNRTHQTITRAQYVTLRELANGKWRIGKRHVGGDTVLSTVASALWRMGLVEREGASRTARPSNPGFRYRITEPGRAAITKYVEGVV